MKITIITDVDKTIRSLESGLIDIVHFLYGWLTTDGEALGYIIGIFHILIIATLFILVFISHTVYPLFWLKCLVFCSLAVILIQHILLRICIMTVAEVNLTQKPSIHHDFLKFWLDKLNISFEAFTTHLIVAETIAVLCFGLEIVSHIAIDLLGAPH